MAKKVLLSATVSVSGNDVTAYCSKVEIEDEFEDKDTTTYGSGGAKEVLGGLESGSIGLSFKNDYGAAALDQLLWGMRRAVVPFTIRADAAAVSATNPQYSGNILINKWTPIAGAVGDVAEVDVTFPLSGPLVRATST